MNKNKPINYILIVLLSILISLKHSFAQERLISLKKSNKGISSFIDQTYSNGKDTFQFKFNSQGNAKIRIEYDFIPFEQKIR